MIKELPRNTINRHCRHRDYDNAQTFIEYLVLISLITAVMLTMTPFLRRGVQGMVKLVADQVGVQRCAEQSGGKSGYLVNAFTTVRQSIEKQSQETLISGGAETYVFPGDRADIFSDSTTNLGFSDRTKYRNAL